MALNIELRKKKQRKRKGNKERERKKNWLQIVFACLFSTQ